MSDAAQPTAAEVRAAAEAVKAALDRHLDAVESRTGEDDPAVYEAFNALAAAAESYDELLYDRYDEVTPFEIPGADDSLPPYDGPRGAGRAQRADPPRLRGGRAGAAARAGQRMPSGGRRRGGARRSSAAACTRRSGVLFGEYEPDEIASRHKEFGLEEGDSTLWVSAAESRPSRGSGWRRPSTQADPQQVVCRFDVSAVFDERRPRRRLADDLEDEELEALDADR